MLRDDTTSMPGFWLANVRYEFYGCEHSFITHVRVTEDDTDFASLGSDAT